MKSLRLPCVFRENYIFHCYSRDIILFFFVISSVALSVELCEDVERHSVDKESKNR